MELNYNKNYRTQPCPAHFLWLYSPTALLNVNPDPALETSNKLYMKEQNNNQFLLKKKQLIFQLFFHPTFSNLMLNAPVPSEVKDFIIKNINLKEKHKTRKLMGRTGCSLFHLICVSWELNISPVYVGITDYPMSCLMVGRSRLSLSANQIFQKQTTLLNTARTWWTRSGLYSPPSWWSPTTTTTTAVFMTVWHGDMVTRHDRRHENKVE